MENSQKARAEIFRNLHHNKKLLILPNAWDAASAKLLEVTGFPAVATASVATALANGYPDGEKIPFNKLLDIVNSVSHALTIPLTVDMEHGFADDVPNLKANIKLLIENGAIGVNIEDSKPGKQELETVDQQCQRIEAVRDMAEKCGIPLVINARVDVFMQKPGSDNLKEAVTRSRAYKSAGADCIYPIMINQYDIIATLISETGLPINVNLQRSVSDLKRLERMGVSRVSLGPGFLYHTLAKMHHLARELQAYDTGAYFDQEPLPKDFLSNLLFR